MSARGSSCEFLHGCLQANFSPIEFNFRIGNLEFMNLEFKFLIVNSEFCFPIRNSNFRNIEFNFPIGNLEFRNLELISHDFQNFVFL
jgi:UDP-galactopyranose mutase